LANDYYLEDEFLIHYENLIVNKKYVLNKIYQCHLLKELLLSLWERLSAAN